MIDKFSYFKFNFSELKVTANEIFPLLGFGPGNNPGPYEQYIDEVLEFANQNVNNISGSLYVSENIEFDTENKKIRVDSLFFDSGKIVTRQLRKSSSVAIFVCTAGPEIEEFSKQQMKTGNIPEGYVADITGSVIVEAAMDKIQNDFAKILKVENMNITNRYSPGYCGWNVAEQQKLFSLLPAGVCGIELTESSLMIPIKSVSGIIGIGKDVKLNPYTCNVCDMHQCIYRNKKVHKDRADS